MAISWTLTLDADRTTRPLLATRFNESSAAISPNGQWMAFTSDQSGRSEVYLTRFPSVDGRIQVSTDGGRQAVWSRDGRRLYYNSGRAQIMAVDVSTASPPALSRPIEFTRLPLAPPTRGTFDVMPDGRLLVVDDESAGGVAEELRIVVNWFDELRQKMAGGSLAHSRMPAPMSQLFQRKPIRDLIVDEADPRALKRVLGAGDLIMLAIGAVIGAGIFGAIGTAAAGQVGPMAR